MGDHDPATLASSLMLNTAGINTERRLIPATRRSCFPRFVCLSLFISQRDYSKNVDEFP